MTSRGYDVNGAADQFTFVYRSVRGDATVIAQVATLQNTDPWSQAGVMIRESLDPSSNHGYVLASAANGLAFRTRKSTKGGTSQVSGGAGAAPMWLKLERRSSSLTAFRSADGVNWSTIGTVKLIDGDNIYVTTIYPHLIRTGSLPWTARSASIAARRETMCPLSSEMPRAYILPSRTVGSNGGLVHRSASPSGCTS